MGEVIQFVPMRSRKVMESTAMQTWLEVHGARVRELTSDQSRKEMQIFVSWLQNKATTTQVYRWLAEHASADSMEWLAAQAG